MAQILLLQQILWLDKFERWLRSHVKRSRERSQVKRSQVKHRHNNKDKDSRMWTF